MSARMATSSPGDPLVSRSVTPIKRKAVSEMHNKVESSGRSKLTRIVYETVFGNRYSDAIFASLIVFEIIFGLLIIKRVAYTEIDWIAYMQEVKGFLDGERNYLNLKGDTGPLVYPAGFVYIYSALYYLTNEGTDILRAQYIFYVLYIVTLIVTGIILRKSTVVPNWAIVALLLSKRIHSIFMLRCFNDTVAMLLLYFAVLCFITDRWKLGSIFFSLGVSVKMNVLLFAPGLLVLYLQRCGILGTLSNLALCLATQVILALPFLLTYPKEYFGKAFEFGRVFTFKWTVNLKFLPEDVFVSKELATGLLAGHLAVLVIYFARRESVHPNGLIAAIRDTVCRLTPRPKNLSCDWILSGLFVSNFIGVAFARSLHYQFYVWYFHSLPFLVCLTPLPFLAKLCCLSAIEYAFNVYPSTPFSSIVLVATHIFLLLGLLVAPRLSDPQLHGQGHKKK